MLSTEQVIARLAVAAALASLIGLERGRLERAAGLRTHAMVGVGAALFMLVSAFGFDDVRGDRNVMLDPSRIAAQVVSGIGFLGAGTIIFQREVVRGLTTAASLWAVAAVGLAVGGGMYIAATAATLMMLIILVGVKPIERRLYPQKSRSLILVIDQRLASLLTIKSTIDECGVRLDRILIQPGDTPDADRVQLRLRQATGENYLALVDALRHIPGIEEIDSPLHVAVNAGTRNRQQTPAAQRHTDLHDDLGDDADDN
ncbi:MAG: MgtC/SapB family protein [Janthinobacterium lividum]